MMHMQSAAQIHQAVKDGQISAQEVTQLAIDSIAVVDKEIHAFLEVTSEAALEAAKHVDKAHKEGTFDSLGPLAGVPVAFKDNMNMSGTHTTCASKMLENYISPYTATCVQNILNAGGIPLGKLNMDEFAFGSSTETSAFGPTKNPWDINRVPGGSSGGSAAAVAAGMVPLSLGSDTGGSIRQPASFCGVVGVKPTYGTVSRYGVVAFGSSLDQVGPFTRTVEDAALAMNVLAKKDERDCTSQHLDVDFTEAVRAGVQGMRVGIVSSFMEAAGLAPEVKEKVLEAARILESQGAELVEVDLPHTEAAISAYYVLGPCEAFSNLARFDSVRYGFTSPGHTDLGTQYEQSRAQGFGPEAKRRIMLGSYLLSAGVYEKYYYPAQQVRTLITQDYAQAYQKCDVIIAPSAPRSAFAFGEIADPVEMHLSDIFTVSINIAGNGGMSMPCGLGSQTGLPVGVQLIAPQFKDENMFQAAGVLEDAYGSAPVAPDFAKRGE
ncbi:MAG: Asp-tRNA(Asn)/Glu-tRNA(Gln) amidotransferase subunit GatA [Eggerthellaceae bacterium]|nr:Asp-tRNA(Asn)/Glu-tRNA(Gln) amidotransferase subunit GatA [Eggerthellaceae bacterium]